MMDGYSQPIQPNYPQFRNNGMPQNFGQFIPSTNKQFVRSLEEALSLPADFNSQNVYFDINKDIMYDICTNGRGEKSWSILNIALAQTSTSTNTVTNDKSLDERMTRIEAKLEELVNGQHNVKQTNPTNEQSERASSSGS